MTLLEIFDRAGLLTGPLPTKLKSKKMPTQCPKYIYIQQYGYYWKYLWSDWCDLVDKSIELNGSFCLLNKFELKGKPRHIAGTGRGQYSTDKNKPLVSPLDWELWQWKEIKTNDYKP